MERPRHKWICPQVLGLHHGLLLELKSIASPSQLFQPLPRSPPGDTRIFLLTLSGWSLRLAPPREGGKQDRDRAQPRRAPGEQQKRP